MSSYGWQKAAKKEFGWSPHPKEWFELLGWITVLSTLQYLSVKTKSIYISIIYYISFIVLFNYIQKILWTKEYQKYLPSKINKKVRVLITYLITVAFAALIWLFSGKIFNDLTKSLLQ